MIRCKRLRVSRLLSRAGWAVLAVNAVACSEWSAEPAVTEPAALREGAAEPAANILLISIDTLRADHLHAYGYDRRTSPAIDRMAQEGVRFADVVAASSWTLPGHATMLTGLDPASHGVVAFRGDSSLPGEVEMLAERFAAAGFRTAAFAGGGWVSSRQGFDRGFERFRSAEQTFRFSGRLKRAVRNAWNWISRHRNERFFFFLHTYQVHMPYKPPRPYDRMFDRGLTGPKRRSLPFGALSTWARDGVKNRAVAAQIRKLYDGEIRFVDLWIGKLLGWLRSSGLDRRTCVLLTSDHGEAFGEHGDFFHDRAKLFQEVTSVPLLVWCPGRLEGGRVVESPVGVVDVAPTALELAGLPVPDDLDGVSLVSQLRGDVVPPGRVLLSDVDLSVERPLLSNHDPEPGFVLGLRRGSYKLIYRSTDGSRQLYDLASDPSESENLVLLRPDVLADFEAPLAAAIERRRSLPEASVARPEAANPGFIEELRALGYVE
ncbi:MAG: sulfatase [Myxococcales bacterium]|nr:sulfatase [Myxococcales bacterium]